LAGYQAKLEELRSEGISVIALSTDPLEKAKETVDSDGLRYPIAWGLKVPEDAERIGAASDQKRGMIQPAEFILGKDRRVLHATYSTGPIGRMTAEDALALIRFLKSRKK
jgi:peroxiredoxin